MYIILHTLPSCKPRVLNSKAQKLNDQMRITFTIFGSRVRLASFTRDWLRRDLHVVTARFICGPKWSSLLYANIYISLEQCPRGKSRVIFNVKGIKSSTKQKKKLKTNFTRRKMALHFWIRNAMFCHFCWPAITLVDVREHLNVCSTVQLHSKFLFG